MTRSSSSKAALARLGHPGVGSVCALVSALLCAVGSALYRWVPQLFQYRLWASFFAPSWHSIWYLSLTATLALWLVHSLLLAREAWTTSFDTKTPKTSRRGAALVRVGFVLAFGGYASTAISAAQQEWALSAVGTDVHGETYRVLRVERSRDRSTALGKLTVWLERGHRAQLTKLEVTRGMSWASLDGEYLLSLGRIHLRTDGAMVRHGDRQVTLATDKPLKEGWGTLLLRRLRRHYHKHGSPVLHADLEISGQPQSVALDPEWAGENAFLGLKQIPCVSLRVHRNLTRCLATLAGISGISLIVGLARRRSRTKRRLAGQP